MCIAEVTVEAAVVAVSGDTKEEGDF